MLYETSWYLTTCEAIFQSFFDIHIYIYKWIEFRGCPNRGGLQVLFICLLASFLSLGTGTYRYPIHHHLDSLSQTCLIIFFYFIYSQNNSIYLFILINYHYHHCDVHSIVEWVAEMAFYIWIKSTKSIMNRTNNNHSEFKRKW